MKYYLLFTILILLSGAVKAQVTIFPDVDRQSEKFLYIKKVELTDQYTIVDFYFRPLGEAWICAENSFHISPYGSNDLMYMIMAKNITTCPKMEKVGSINEDLEFQLWFPPLREKVYKINIIEKAKRGLNFYGVDIINGQERPVPDSSSLRTYEEFEKYFNEHADSLDPIEGIWHAVSKLDMYEDTKLIDRNYILEEDTIAILKDGDKFVSFNIEGKNLEVEYKWITGGRGYYYQEYYRELHEIVSTYIKVSSTIQYEINYEVPERMTRAILMSDYFPQYRLQKNFLFKKKYPDTEEIPVEISTDK